MTVAADERAVEADVTGGICRHNGELCGCKVLFDDAVLLVEIGENGELGAVGAFLFLLRGDGADEYVQVFAGDAVTEGLGALILCQMGQKVGDGKDGICGLCTDFNINNGAVLQRHNALECQRNRRPLILLDAAVIVGLQIAKLLAVLIQRHGF